MLPSFIIIGAQRGGTTSLYNYLAKHPQIVATKRREVHFFTLHHSRGFDWYRRQFPSALRARLSRLFNGELITGESTPYYLFHPAVPARVHAFLPHIKLIALLRNPVDRAFSHYHLVKRKNQETLSFADALAAEPERLAGEEEKLLSDPAYYSVHHHHHAYLRRGLYAEQLERWLSFFPREQIHVVASEQLYREPRQVVGETLRFLKPEWPTWEADGYPRFNATEHEPMAAELRARLLEFFRPHNQRLYALLGRDLGWDS